MTSWNRIGGNLLAALVLIVGFGPTRAAAQNPQEGLFVTIPHTFPDIDARAIVIREGRREVIMLRSDEATAETLSVALAVLRRVRRQALPANQGQMLPITGYARRAQLDSNRRVDLERVLDNLARRPVTDVGRFGPGRWIRYNPK